MSAQHLQGPPEFPPSWACQRGEEAEEAQAGCWGPAPGTRAGQQLVKPQGEDWLHLLQGDSRMVALPLGRQADGGRLTPIPTPQGQLGAARRECSFIQGESDPA